MYTLRERERERDSKCGHQKMNWENRLLLEFEKQLVEIQDHMRTTKCFRGIHRT